MPRPLKLSALEQVDDGPPREPLGYLAPEVGTFFLDGDHGPEGRRGDGYAQFVFSHERGLVVDTHSGPIRFVRVVKDSHGHQFWVYRFDDPVEPPPIFILLAQEREPGEPWYRIFYGHSSGNEGERGGSGSAGRGGEEDVDVHLWAWNAVRFLGHGHEHDHV